MIAYIIKSSLSLILMFGLYWVFLRKEKLFRFNRFFLIFSILISLVIPYISVPVNIQNKEIQKNIVTVLNYNIPEVTAVTAPVQKRNSVIENTNQDITQKMEPVVVDSSGISFTLFLFVLYFSGVVLLLFRFLRNILFISHQKQLSENTNYSGQKLVLVDSKINPYCFLNAIYVSKLDYLENRIDNELLNHEVQHIKQAHSIDIIFMELIQSFYWFNPVLILYNKAARVNHEYLADNAVISNSINVKSYSDILLNFISCRRNIPLTSGFNQSLTRKRLIMLTKTKSRNYLYGIRILTTLILVLVSFFILSIVPSNSQPIIPKLLNSFQSPTVSDIDGNNYQTVRIGNQVWMAENLKTTRYNDGTNIPIVIDSTKWKEYAPAFCWYKNDKKTYKDKYGALYNWYSVNTTKLCPSGWHVPTSDEIYYSLQDNLMKNGFGYGKDGKDVAKSLASTSGWKRDSVPGRVGNDQSGNNSSEFNAIPVGYRGQSGTFGSSDEAANWWTSSDNNTYVGNSWFLASYYSRISPWWGSKRTGFSVRCVLDNTNVTNHSSINAPNSVDSEQLQQKEIISTLEGVSQELLLEYQNIVNKYKTIKGKQQSFNLNLTPSEKAKLEEIFLQMSKVQQSSQVFVFVPSSTLLFKKTIPTKEQFQSFKDSKIYGVWIDYKKVKNEVLNNYIYSDFSSVFVSKLMPNAANGIYDYQVNLMTNHYFQDNNNRTIAKKGNTLILNLKNTNRSLVNNDEKVSKDTLNTENIHESIANFSGSWILNKPKSAQFLQEIENYSRDMTILQKGDTVTFSIKNNLPDRKPIKSTRSLILNSKGIVSKTGEKTETVSAEWSKDKQSFFIMDILTYPKEGTIIEMKRIETYTLVEGGKTLIVNYNDTGNNKSLVPDDERNFNMVYDKILPVKNPFRVAVFADKSQGFVSKAKALNTYSLEVKILNYDGDLKYEITSFSFLSTSNNIDTEFKAEGNKLTDEMKSYIAHMKRQQSFIFKDIRALGSDGNTAKLPPIIIQIE